MNTDISDNDILNAYKTAAKIVIKFGDAYLPTFQRLHDEVQKRQQQQQIKTLALSIANGIIINDE